MVKELPSVCAVWKWTSVASYIAGAARTSLGVRNLPRGREAVPDPRMIRCERVHAGR